MKPLANLLSLLLHPLWMPTITLVVCFRIDPFMRYGFTEQGTWILFGMVFVMTALFPLSSALLMRRTGLVTDITMPQRGERVPALLITFLYYGICYYLLRRTLEHPLTLGIFLGAVLGVLLCLLITLRWKISAHMMGIGGFIGALLAVMVTDGREAPLLLATGFVAAGALGTARLLASDHTPAQILTGAALGFACTYGCAANLAFI